MSPSRLALPIVLPIVLGIAVPAAAQQLDLSHGGPVQVNAAGGIDWRQDDQTVIAHGDARAVRGTVTVTADQLIAHYRKKAGAATPAASTKPGSTGEPDATSDTQVYRLDAVGHVHIFTPTDQAWGDKAVYDMDQSVLVLTGHVLRLLTPQDLLTARDSLEYWPQRHIAIARGNAVVLTNDAKRVAADVLVAYTTPGASPPGTPNKAKPVTEVSAPGPGAPSAPAAPPADPIMASGKLQKVEAYGNVDVRTPTETVHGDRGVYVPDTQRAHVIGNVHITRGQNQLNGSAADVNMATGVATLLSGAQQRVQGLIVPNDAQTGAQKAGAQKTGAQKPGAPKMGGEGPAGTQMPADNAAGKGAT